MLLHPSGGTARRAPAYEEFELRHALTGLSAVSAPTVAVSDLERIHQDYGLSGAGQTVAVIDTGIAYDHWALGGGLGSGYRVVGGWDFTAENDADPYDDPPAGFHGTHVSGIIGSADPNHLGLAPGVDFVALRVVDDRGASEYAWIERALRWVHQHRNDFEFPITTVNLSMGSLPGATVAANQRILDDELTQLAEDGILVVAAAGNGYDFQPVTGLSYPASQPSVLAVGSVDAQGQLSVFSRRDPRMLLAPGEQILSSIPDQLYSYDGIPNDWRAFSGTSQAAPYVAGGAMLLREALQRSGVAQPGANLVTSILRQTADNVFDASTQRTYLRVNLLSAVKSVLGEVDPRSAASQPPRLSLPVNAQRLGAIEFQKLERVRATVDPIYYQLTATRDGILSAAAQFGNHDEVDWQLFDRRGVYVTPQPVGRDMAARDDWHVSAGETYYLRLQGDNSLGNLTLANLLNVDESNSVRLQLPNAVEAFDVNLSDGLRLSVGDLEYGFGLDTVRRLLIGAIGSPTVRVAGSDAPDRFVVKRGLVAWQQGTHTLEMSGVNNVELRSLTQQGDEARLYGTTAAESYVSRNGTARLVGQDLAFAALNFDRVFVFAGGGADQAELQGSAGDDIFVSQGRMARFSSAAHLDWVEDVERIYAYAGEAGVDKAFLYGSDADDILVAHPDWTRLTDNQQLRQVGQFDRVYATAGEGGVDRGYLYGSGGNDEFHAELAAARLSGPDYLAVASAFDRLYVDGGGGHADTASLWGSELDDRYVVDGVETVLSSAAYLWQLTDFDRIDANAGVGGNDQVLFWATQEDTQLEIGRDRIRLQTARAQWHAAGFTSVSAQAGSGRHYALVALETSDPAINDRTRRKVTNIETVGYRWLATNDELENLDGVHLVRSPR